MGTPIQAGIKNARAFLTTFAELKGQEDPRLPVYKQLDGYTDFNEAYREALSIAEREGHADIARRLKEY